MGSHFELQTLTVGMVGTHPMAWLSCTPTPLPITPWDQSMVTRILRTYSIAEADLWAHLYLLHVMAPGPYVERTDVEYSDAVLACAAKSTQLNAARAIQHTIRMKAQKTENRKMQQRLNDTQDRKRRGHAPLCSQGCDL